MSTLLLLLIAMPALFFILRLLKPRDNPKISNTKLMRGDHSDSLVVVLHAYTSQAKNMTLVNAAIRSALGDGVDIFCPSYNVGLFSNTSIAKLAAQIEDNIEQYWDEKLQQDGIAYRRVILVGHSAGALLSRKVYLYGCGGSVDYPLGIGQNSRSIWVDRVERIVLLAGINRGWSTENMTFAMRILTSLGRGLCWFISCGDFIFSFERGSPFVSNLKMEWTRLHHSGQQVPAVIQLLGDSDEIAPEGDHKELMASPGFIFIPVSNASHANIINMPLDSDDLELRLRVSKFREALATSREKLQEKYNSNRHFLDVVDPNRSVVEHLVFLVHGIRDYAEWVNQLASKFETEPQVRAITSKYGYFPMARFLFLSDREKNVRWFVDQYAEAMALYPNVKKISFVGHSNGTYLLASALEKYHAIRFDNIYFAGSVVRSDFPWNAYVNQERVGKVRNDLADEDIVVAWFPKLYQIIRKLFDFDPRGFFNLGGAGFDGFEASEGHYLEGRLAGGHGAGVKPENFSSIVKFVLNDSIVLPLMANGPHPRIRLLSNLAPVVWLGLAGIITFFGWVFMLLAAMIHVPATMAIPIYSIIVIAALYML